MPTSALRPCASPGCPELVAQGRCARHRQALEQARGTRSERGYTNRWLRFRARFIARLIERNIAPVCGAALPGGPAMAESRCQARGLVTGGSLHLHHDPPLRPDERDDERAVCDELRVGLLCADCHRAATSATRAR